MMQRGGKSNKVSEDQKRGKPGVISAEEQKKKDDFKAKLEMA